MAGVTHDDGFHEIQLNGKQLVFLFMAVTVVSVVIFLCGVLVGRGVRLDRAVDAVAAAEPGEVPPPPPVDTVENSTQPVAQSEPTTFTQRLEEQNPQTEKLPPRDVPVVRSEPVFEAAPAPAPAPARPEASKPSSPAAAPAVSPAGPAEPAGPGVAVQVSAFRVRQEADALANRLIGKGYAAYVVPPAPGAPALFRVRVGKFKESSEATKVAQKLKKEEQFDPWIVR
jgi:cell division septation protein DedD